MNVDVCCELLLHVEAVSELDVELTRRIVVGEGGGGGCGWRVHVEQGSERDRPGFVWKPTDPEAR